VLGEELHRCKCWSRGLRRNCFCPKRLLGQCYLHSWCWWLHKSTRWVNCEFEDSGICIWSLVRLNMSGNCNFIMLIFVLLCCYLQKGSQHICVEFPGIHEFSFIDSCVFFGSSSVIIDTSNLLVWRIEDIVITFAVYSFLFASF